MRLPPFSLVLALSVVLSGTVAPAQTIVIDTFNNTGNPPASTGAVVDGRTWSGQVTQNATSITVGGTARDDNGWGSTSLAVNATGMAYVRITAQRNTGNTNPSVVVQFEDSFLTPDSGIFSVPSSAFQLGATTIVQIPITTWGSALFDPADITGYSIGGGAAGSTAFRMTLENLELSSSLAPLAGGTIITAGNQVYTTSQTLTGSTTLGNLNGQNGTGTAITFNSTIDGAHALTLNNSGATTLAGAVGNVTPLTSLTTDAGGTTAINGGKVITTGAQTYNDSVTLGADTQIKTTVSGVIAFVEALVGNNHSLLIESPDAVAFNSASGLTALTKMGSGTMTMTGTSTYTGATNINGGILNLTGSATSSAFTVNSGARLMGTGSLGALSLMSGGTLAPGASTGTLSAGNASFAGGSYFNFELSNATGTRGTSSGWDLLSIGGSLSLSASAGNPFTLRLSTLNGTASGLAANFDAASSYSFTFVATTGGVTGFATNAFAFDTTGFQNLFSGTWTVGQSGNDLVLNYSGASAIPEPSTYAAIAGACALGLAVWQRRRSRSGAGSPPEFLV